MLEIDVEYLGSYRRTRCNNCHKDCKDAKGVTAGSFIANLCLNCRKELKDKLIKDLEEYVNGK